MILIATGMVKEARIMAAPGVKVIVGGGDSARLERELEALAPQARLILSSGLAGALSPKLKVGDVVLDGPEALLPAIPGAYHGPILGSDTALASVVEKQAAAKTGALAVDMESHIARRVAERHGLPFLAARVISDTATHTLPPSALVGMRPDGTMALGAVLLSLARNPRQLPALIRTGRDADQAFRALGRLHHVLAGVGIG